MELVPLRSLIALLSGCLVVSLSGLAQNAAPDSGAPLSLEECIRRAIAAPSAVSLARRDREIAGRGIRIARASFLPMSSISTGYLYNSPQPGSPGLSSFAAVNGIREFTELANVSQEIDISGRLRAEYARARAQQNATVASLAMAERDLKRAVGAAYYRLLLERHIVEALRDVLRESEAFTQRVRALAAGGEAASADVIKAAAQEATLRQGLVAAELAATLANQELAAFWTDAVTHPLQLVDSLESPIPEPQAASTESTPYLRRWEFQLLDAQRLGFTSQAKAAKAVLRPQLSWSFQYGLDGSRVAWNNRGYTAFASLRMPVFDWFRARDTARQFQLQAEKIGEARAIAVRKYSQEYEAALERTKQFYAQVELCRTQAALFQEDLRLSRLRFEGGEGRAVDVVVAQGQLAQARVNYYSSIANYMNARLDLEVAAAR